MKMQPNMSELFDQAIETFDSAMKTGVRIQEEATRWWTDMLRETDSLQELQHRAQSMMMETLPTTQKNVDQYMKLLDRTYQSSMELLGKAMQSTQSGSMSEAQQRIQEFWESTFSALRTNAQAIVQVNARTMEVWADMARRDSGGAMNMAKDAAKEAARAATQSMARPGSLARGSARTR